MKERLAKARVVAWLCASFVAFTVNAERGTVYQSPFVNYQPIGITTVSLTYDGTMRTGSVYRL